MERIIKKRITEDPLKFTGLNPRTYEKVIGSNKRNEELIDKFLEDPRVQEVYKVIIDIKPSVCYMNTEGRHLECYIPIKDDAHYFLDDYISIFIDNLGSFIGISTPHVDDYKTVRIDQFQDELRRVVKQLEEDFKVNLNFQLLKEYLEEET